MACKCASAAKGRRRKWSARVICERVACKNAIRHAESGGKSAEIRVRVTQHSRRRRCIIREAGWLAVWRLEGGRGAWWRRPLGSSFTAHADRPTDDCCSANATRSHYIVGSSLMRNGAKHVPPLGVLGRQLDAPRRNKCVSPTTLSSLRTAQCSASASRTCGGVFRQATCVPINSTPTRRQCRTYCSAKLTRRRRENYTNL